VFKHTSNDGVYRTLRNVTSHMAPGASRARWLIDRPGTNKHSCRHGTWLREFLAPWRHSLRLWRSVVDCITLRYVTLACLIFRQTRNDITPWMK